MWRYNHGPEPALELLRAFVRNAHDVVLRGDDKACDAREVEEILAIQLALLPPDPKNKKARNKGKKGSIQQRMEGL